MFEERRSSMTFKGLHKHARSRWLIHAFQGNLCTILTTIKRLVALAIERHPN